jgi:ABC-2 type transport system ATP-binding protein/lipopolysaccharide transport system ATP-binding protein
MTTHVVETERLGKRYRIGERGDAYRTLRDTIAAAVAARTARLPAQEVWALRDVDLSISEGEVVGIVGRNGAGKTTLLKILTRITQPTIGLSRTRGRVGALLEVGTGFHPELTGRENVYLNGAILGMAKRDISARFDTIVEFAGVGRFIDTPLKRYSSGMQLRLAFSVAAHLEPDLIVVDEVLAVGDVEFQRRCLGRMSELTAAGRTVLFVSHDVGALGRLCSRTIWLDRGRIVSDGDTQTVLAEYLASLGAPATRVDLASPGAGPVRVLSVEVRAAGDGPPQAPVRDEPLCVRTRFGVVDDVAALDVSVSILSEAGTIVLSEAWSDSRRQLLPPGARGEYEVTLRVPPILASGTYRLRLWVGTPYEDFFREEVMAFEVRPRYDDLAEFTSRETLIRPDVAWSLEEGGDRRAPASADVQGRADARAGAARGRDSTSS